MLTLSCTFIKTTFSKSQKKGRGSSSLGFRSSRIL